MVDKTRTIVGGGYDKTRDTGIAGRPGEKILEAGLEKRGIEEDYFGATEDYAAVGLESSQNILERELAKLRMRMGYNQSAGAGTGGRWDLARGNMLNAGAQKQMQLGHDWEKWEAQQAQNWAIMQDQQAHGEKMAQLQYQYNLELMKQQAELNDPTWWQTFGSIVGMGAGLWGMAGFPMPNFGGGFTGDPNFPP